MESSDGATHGPEYRDFVSALATGLNIVEAFDEENPRMTLSEVAARNGIDRAKARRFLLTLYGLGYVRKTGRYFELAPRILDLGYAFLSANRYQSVVRPRLEQLTEVTGESSSMGVLSGGDVVYVSRSAAPHRLMTITLSVGSRLPAIATSMGRVLLTTLDDMALNDFFEHTEIAEYTSKTVTDRTRLREILAEVRAQEYCIVDQELEPGLRSLAVPTYNCRGELIGAINVSTNAARVTRERLEHEFLDALRATSLQIRRDLSQ